MELEYIAEILSDGHLSVDPSVYQRFAVGERVMVRLVALPAGQSGKDEGKANISAQGFDPATARLMDRMRGAKSLGAIKGNLTREEIYEDRLDEIF